MSLEDTCTSCDSALELTVSASKPYHLDFMKPKILAFDAQHTPGNHRRNHRLSFERQKSPRFLFISLPPFLPSDTAAHLSYRLFYGTPPSPGCTIRRHSKHFSTSAILCQT